MLLETLALLVYVNCVCAAQAQPWWSNAVYYRVLVDSFKDGDGDGLGDLMGLTKQLSYVKALGADAVIVSPITLRSSDCSRPGTLDFTDIDPRYGSFDILNALLDKAAKLDLKVVVTLPLQTISSAADWFTSSVDLKPGFENWVVWNVGEDNIPPLAEDGIDWMRHETRKSYYGTRHKETLINLCSEAVSATLSAAVCAWVKRNVSGLLLNPDYPRDQDCGEKLLKKLIVDGHNCARTANLDAPVFLVESNLLSGEASKYYGKIGSGASSLISRALSTSARGSPAEMGLAFYADMLHAPDDLKPTWITSATGDSHVATRYGSVMVDAINLLALTLPGAAIVQQGDELGLADTILEWASNNDICWPIPLTPSAAPFPWDNSLNGGFSNNEPWLPLAPNYRYANAKTEFASDFSHVAVVRIAAAMRKSPAIGPHAEIKRLGDSLAVLRWGGTGSLLVVSNVGSSPTEAELSRFSGLPSEMTVAASSGGSSLSTGSHISLQKALKLIPGETILLAGGPRHCGGPGPVDKIANKLNEGWQKINKYFSN